MKVGSLVECIEAKWQDNKQNITLPIVGEIYVIREIFPDLYYGKTYWYVKLNECPAGLGFRIESFREVQPPMDVAELISNLVPQDVNSPLCI